MYAEIKIVFDQDNETPTGKVALLPEHLEMTNIEFVHLVEPAILLAMNNAKTFVASAEKPERR